MKSKKISKKTSHVFTMLSEKTNIIATLGSSSDSDSVLEKMIKQGLTIIRVNMSHGDHQEHHEQIVAARRAAKNLKTSIKIIVDLAGPKIRIGQMEKDTVLEEGKKVTITTKPCLGNASRFSVSYKNFAKEVKKGHTILINDGKRTLQVLSTNGIDEIICKVTVGGSVTSRKGINVPGAYLGIPTISPKDKIDMQFAADHKADYVAVSFVRSPKDLVQARALLQKYGSNAKIISKIETQEAINDLENIIKESDMVMVARGDLAMEIGFHLVPIEQKRILMLGKKYDKPVIIATQVLDSMEKSPTPTRAEVSDIAGAVFDGAYAVMLSGETTVGDYPVQSVEVMRKVANSVEIFMANAGK